MIPAPGRRTGLAPPGRSGTGAPSPGYAPVHDRRPPRAGPRTPASPPHPHGRAARRRHRADRRRDDRHQQRRARPIAGGARCGRGPDRKPARRPRRRGRGAARRARPGRTSWSPRAVSDPRRTTSPARRSHEVCGEDVSRSIRLPSPGCEGLWARRGHPFPSVNVKQAWVIPSATTLPNPNGTAPGWWVDRPDGRVIVTLPGPPREMRPMWTDEVLPLLAVRGVGADLDVRTLRLHGIGESQVAEVLGDALLRERQPGRGDVCAPRGRRRPDQRAIHRRAERRGPGGRGGGGGAAGRWAIRLGTGRHDLGRGPGRGAGRPAAGPWRPPSVAPAGRSSPCCAACARCGRPRSTTTTCPLPTTRRHRMLMVAEAERVRASAGADVGFAIHAINRGNDTRVLIGVAAPSGTTRGRAPRLPARCPGRRPGCDRGCSRPAGDAQGAARGLRHLGAAVPSGARRDSRPGMSMITIESRSNRIRPSSTK